MTEFKMFYGYKLDNQINEFLRLNNVQIIKWETCRLADNSAAVLIEYRWKEPTHYD